MVMTSCGWNLNSRPQPSWRALICLLAIAAIGCADLGADPVPSESVSPQPPSPSGQISFQAQVRPVFQSYACLSCHGSAGGLSVATASDLLRGGDHGPAVVAGRAESSLLLAKLSPAPPFGSRMPQGGPFLPDTAIVILRLWINQGAKNN
jgi:hypothetical protein